jgi:hypothetical protein
MICKMLSHCTLASAILVLATSALAADGQDETSLQGEKYHLALGKTYNMQAHDHARLLSKYAAVGERVPADVVKEHAAAIRFNAQAARKSFTKLEGLAKTDPALSQQVAQMQQRLDKVNALVAQLEARVEQQGELQSETVAAQTAEISQQLRSNHVSARETDDRFYNADSDAYYFTGEGHFVD